MRSHCSAAIAGRSNAEPKLARIQCAALTMLFWICALFVEGGLAAVGAAEPAAGRPSLLQDDFPFQGACIGAPFPSNNVAMKGLAIYTSGRDQIGVSPDGQVTSSDNEGTWVPTTPIHWIKPHQFCGVINKLTLKETAAGFVPPLCWLAKSYDNSGGGQIWVTSERWGPFRQEMLHESYGQSSLFLVMRQQLPNGRLQGGVVKFPLRFTSSVMRARFNKKDGQLYVCGLSEWQSNAGRITGFDRVRYTGKTVYSVRGLTVDRQGVHLSFTQPLSRDSAEDLQNFSAKRWNYERAEHYGSPEFSVENPAKRGRDSLIISGSTLSLDGFHLTVQISDLKPVMQQTLKFNLKAADGTPISQEIMHSIHALP